MALPEIGFTGDLSANAVAVQSKRHINTSGIPENNKLVVAKNLMNALGATLNGQNSRPVSSNSRNRLNMDTSI